MLRTSDFSGKTALFLNILRLYTVECAVVAATLVVLVLRAGVRFHTLSPVTSLHSSSKFYTVL